MNTLKKHPAATLITKNKYEYNLNCASPPLFFWAPCVPRYKIKERRVPANEDIRQGVGKKRPTRWRLTILALILTVDPTFN